MGSIHIEPKEYDFVIVGGGTSGLVVANRLSENEDISVLVIEAGPDARDDPRVKTPALYQALLGTELNWGFETVPQRELHDRTIKLDQGKVLGGSSSLNAQLLVPPGDTLIDGWEQLGNEGWNWKTLEPYFSKFFSVEDPPAALREHLGPDWLRKPVNESTAPIRASFGGRLEDEVPKAWIETFRRKKLLLKDDLFSGPAMGAFSTFSSVNFETKERISSAIAYYTPASGRSNLHLETGCTVQKVLLEDGATVHRLNASSVQYEQNGRILTVKARKEVILAAGALQTPKLLELSGIGGKDLLQSYGIEVKIELPGVGENLQDHVLSGLSFEAMDNVNTVDDIIRQTPEAIEAAMGEYIASKSGIFTNSMLSSYALLPTLGSVFSRSEVDDLIAQNDKKRIRPDCKIQNEVLTKIYTSEKEATGAVMTLCGQVPFDRGDALGPGKLDGKYLTLVVFLTHPFSRGSCHITSAEPDAKPAIDPRYLSHPADLEILARHMRDLDLDISRSAPFSDLLKPNGRRNSPRAYMDKLEEAKDYARRTAITVWHPCGTAAMLPRERQGVLDPNLVVYGTSNLRVVDASMMPMVSRGNTQATVYAVAERAADIIKANHGI